MACSSSGRETNMYVNLVVVVVNDSKQMGLESISARRMLKISNLFLVLYIYCFFGLYYSV